MIEQLDRTQAPPAGPAPQVDLGEYQSFTLPNGMRVIIVENHRFPMVSAQVRFDIPPILQGEKAGYHDLLGELLTSGTINRSKQRIDELVDGCGAKFNGNGEGLHVSCLSKYFPRMLDLIQDVVLHASYPEDEFQKAKTRSASQISARADEPDQIAEVVGHALTFGKHHPYGEVATEATLARVERSDLQHFHHRFFRPEKGYIVLVGDITVKDAHSMAEGAFSAWNGARGAKAHDHTGHEVVQGPGPITQVPTKRVAFVDRAGSAQSVIKVVFPVDLKPNDPMALHAQVLNTILGGGVFNARLMQNLREDKGYTYGAYSSLDPDRWAGSFSAGCSVRNEVTNDAVAQIMKEIRGMKEAPVTEAELALAKSYMAGSFARSLEDPRTVARFALNTFLYDLPENHYETYLERLSVIGIADIQAAAERFLHPEHATILVVGDKQEVMGTLVDLTPSGKVLEFDINGDPVPTSAG